MACGTVLLPGVLAGTLAVSFLLSVETGAGAMAGVTMPGAGGLGAVDGGTAPAGGLGAVDGGGGGATAPGGFGATGGAEGGLGRETPLGGAGGVAADPTGAGGATGAGGTTGLVCGEGAVPAGFWTGLGGKLIIAVSRGFDARG